MLNIVFAVLLVPQGLLIQSSSVSAEKPRDSYRVPYRLTDTQHLLVRAKVNGKGPYNFLIDTGAPAIFLAPKIAKAAGITSDKAQWGKIKTLEIEGGAVQNDAPARIEEVYQMEGMNRMGLAGAQIDGIFGYTLLSQYKLGIDLSETTMTWTPTPFDAMKFLSASMMRAGNVKPPKQAAEDLEQMKRMAKWASSLFPNRGQKDTLRRAFFGMEIADATNGAEVKVVLSGSPADAAGLKTGDRITHIAKTDSAKPVTIANASALLAALAEITSNESITFTIWRGTTKSRLTVTGAEGV
jgi:hypothetical protein